jgi:hypothetical protein
LLLILLGVLIKGLGLHYTIAVVASLETLLSMKAADRMDVQSDIL